MQTHDHRPRLGPSPLLKKRLGQHHLVDGKLCRPLIEFLEPRGRRVVEIGPGGGLLTRELQSAGAEVLALEVDPEWAFALRAALAEPVATVVADALVFPWHRLPAGTQVAGNLPYNIATPLIERVLQQPDQIPKAAFLVQKEVALRLVAQPGDKPYGLLSVLTAARADVRLLGTVKPGSFRPPPKVDSAFVGLTLHPPPLPEVEMPAFVQTVQTAFAQRRKTLQNNLTRVWPKSAVLAALEDAALDPVRRAETLSLEEFLALHRALR